MDRLMTVIEVHEMTRLAVQTLYSLVSAGKIPYVKLGSRLLFVEEDIIHWILSKRVEPKTPEENSLR